MKLNRLFFLVICLVTFILISIISSVFFNNRIYCNSSSELYTNDEEIDSRILITSKNTVVFASNSLGVFKLFEYDNEIINPLAHSMTSVSNPFLFEKRVVGLIDNNGDENFISTDSKLNSLLNFQPISFIKSFNDGFLVVVKLKNDRNIYLLNIVKGTKNIVQRNVDIVHEVCFSKSNNHLVINYDGELVYFNLNNGQFRRLSKNTGEDNMTPYIYGTDVYFSNNDKSDFFQIYKVNLNDSFSRVSLIYTANHDLRMPKFNGKELFFIEILNNEYLLKKLNLENSDLEMITERGVIYMYDFLKNGDLIFSYSDFFTPRSLFKYSYLERTIKALTGRKIKTDLSLEFISKTEDKSPAYIISPTKESVKGVILFIHPGLHSDFSPRWDILLMNLSKNGYLIVCPNYPMSSGWGKKYNNASYTEAILDLERWKTNLLERFKNSPLYYVSSSSGNILMEKALLNSDKKVVASVSLFGVPNLKYPDPTVPSLYLLGKNDPIVDFEDRIRNLGLSGTYNKFISVTSYSDEGHWFRNKKNVRHAVNKILNHFCQSNE